MDAILETSGLSQQYIVYGFFIMAIIEILKKFVKTIAANPDIIPYISAILGVLLSFGVNFGDPVKDIITNGVVIGLIAPSIRDMGSIVSRKLQNGSTGTDGAKNDK